MPNNTQKPDSTFAKILWTVLVLALLIAASGDVFRAGWGSGNLVGRFSLKWLLTFGGFALVCLVFGTLGMLALWQPEHTRSLRQRVLALRPRPAWGRYLLAVAVLLLAVGFFLYTPWGTIFTGFAFRLWVFVLVVAVVGWALTPKPAALVSWPALLAAAVLLGSVFVLAVELTNVNGYPFALYWSEGNRLWDYSVLYGRDLYNYPAGQAIPAAIDPGRQSLWGLPFLLPAVSIVGVRLWSALLFTIPYAILGWMLLKPRKEQLVGWFLFGLWTLAFLNQGPIYTPLVLAAILIAGVRKRSMWLAFPMLVLAGYYAHQSRYTWMFAPAFWIIILAMVQPVIEERKLTLQDWLRGGVLGLAGMLGSFVIPRMGPRIIEALRTGDQVTIETIEGAGHVLSGAGVAEATARQPLLWARLWPNETFGMGIVLALVVTTLPLILLLIYLVAKRRIQWNLWQILAVSGPLLAFLVVGLVASVKVGGGTNLHNMDMFLVTLVFVAALVWEAGIGERLGVLLGTSTVMQTLLALIVLVPAFSALLNARPLALPPQDKTDLALFAAREYVSCAQQYGEVLFMDQRQLLTFGFVENVPLVSEYEKKLVMDEALSGSAAYFESFYADLASHRFALIISDRQAIREKETGESLAEENNAWVEWVTEPLFREYESVENFKLVGMELFMPLGREYTCP